MDRLPLDVSQVQFRKRLYSTLWESSDEESGGDLAYQKPDGEPSTGSCHAVVVEGASVEGSGCDLAHQKPGGKPSTGSCHGVALEGASDEWSGGDLVHLKRDGEPSTGSCRRVAAGCDEAIGCEPDHDTCGDESPGTPTTPREGDEPDEITNDGAAPSLSGTYDVANCDLLDLLVRDIPKGLKAAPRKEPTPCKRDPNIEIMTNRLLDARDQVSALGVSRWVTFAVRSNPSDVLDAARRLVDEIQGSFYIGITSGPGFRYDGGDTPSGNYVQGHVRTWRFMVVIGQCFGHIGLHLEKALINWALSAHSERCANERKGGGGIVVDAGSVTFVYVCHTLRSNSVSSTPARAPHASAVDIDSDRVEAGRHRR